MDLFSTGGDTIVGSAGDTAAAMDVDPDACTTVFSAVKMVGEPAVGTPSAADEVEFDDEWDHSLDVAPPAGQGSSLKMRQVATRVQELNDLLKASEAKNAGLEDTIKSLRVALDESHGRNKVLRSSAIVNNKKINILETPPPIYYFIYYFFFLTRNRGF